MRAREKTFLILLFLFTLCNKAFSQFQHIVNKPYKERYLLLDSVFYYSGIFELDSNICFSKTEKLKKVAQTANDAELLSEVELIRSAYYILGKQQDHNKVEPILFPLLKKAQDHNDLITTIRARQFLAAYYMMDCQYSKALDHYLHSYYLLKNVTLEEYPNKSEAIYNIASAYYNYGDYDKAKIILNESMQFPIPAVPHNHFLGCSVNAINTLGLIYRKTKKYDSAEIAFKRAYNLAKEGKADVWVGITGGNLGITYYLTGRYGEAMPLLKDDVERSFRAKLYDNGLNSLIKLADVYFIKRDIDSATNSIALADKIIDEKAKDKNKLKAAICLLKSKLYAYQNNMPLAYRYADSARILQDSVVAKKNSIVTARYEQRIQEEKYKADIELIKSQKRFTSLLYGSVVGIFLLLIVIMLLFINRQKLKHKQEKLTLAIEKKYAEHELENATRQLKEFAKSIYEKNKIIEQFADDLEQLRTTQINSTPFVNNEVLAQLQNATILTERQWNDFRELFDKVHVGYIDRLKQKHPDLTQSEIRFAVLTKLNLSNKEMAAMLGVGNEAIRQYRYRLRKKLNLAEDNSLEEVIDMI